MKKKNKYLIQDIKYSENNISKKILKNIKISDIIFYLTYVLLTILYLSFIFVKIKTGTLLIISILYFLFVFELAFLQRLYTNNVIKESIKVTVCPEALLDLSLYCANKRICNEKSFNYYLNNIAKAYILSGKTEKALKIIKQLDKNKKDMLLQAEILQNKMEIAFIKGDLKEFNKHYDNYNKILKFIPKKYKNEVKLDNKLKQAVLENDKEAVKELCENSNKKKDSYTEVMIAYYKGVVLEKIEKEKSDEYFQFVAENGNNLMIANQVRKKLNITKTNEKYKRKKHRIFNIYKFITFTLSLFICFIWLFLLFRSIK